MSKELYIEVKGGFLATLERLNLRKGILPHFPGPRAMGDSWATVMPLTKKRRTK